jgi:anti-anti-sigma factor
MGSKNMDSSSGVRAMTRFERRDAATGNVTVVAVHGELDVRHVGGFDRTLLELVPDPERALIVSLIECDFVDSVGVAALHAAFRRVQARGRRPMAIVSPAGSEVRRRLRRAGLEELIPTFDSVDDACAAPIRTTRARRPTDLFGV